MAWVCDPGHRPAIRYDLRRASKRRAVCIDAALHRLGTVRSSCCFFCGNVVPLHVFVALTPARLIFPQRHSDRLACSRATYLHQRPSREQSSGRDHQGRGVKREREKNKKITDDSQGRVPPYTRSCLPCRVKGSPSSATGSLRRICWPAPRSILARCKRENRAIRGVSKLDPVNLNPELAWRASTPGRVQTTTKRAPIARLPLQPDHNQTSLQIHV